MSREERPLLARYSKDTPLSEEAKSVLAASFAYGADPVWGNIDERILPSGCEVLLSELFEEEGGNKCRATVIIDRAAKTITYAIAGTRIDQGLDKAKADLGDDARLAIGWLPEKVKPLKKLNGLIITELGAELKDYTIDFIGHSLGGALADVAATDMLLQMDVREQKPPKISSTTFENPGAYTAVKNLCKQYGTKIEDLKGRIKFRVFNNRPNGINTMDQQVAEKLGGIHTIVPNDQKPVNGFSMMCGNIAKKLRKIPILGKIMKFLSYGRITKQVADHSLANFENVIVQGDGQIRSKGQLMTVEEALQPAPKIMETSFRATESSRRLSAAQQLGAPAR